MFLVFEYLHGYLHDISLRCGNPQEALVIIDVTTKPLAVKMFAATNGVVKRVMNTK